MREPSATLDQSYYGSQLVYAVGYFFFSIAKSEWWGGDKKKLENWNLTCLVEVLCIIRLLVTISISMVYNLYITIITIIYGMEGTEVEVVTEVQYLLLL